jgi:hypothetical protein
MTRSHFTFILLVAVIGGVAAALYLPDPTGPPDSPPLQAIAPTERAAANPLDDRVNVKADSAIAKPASNPAVAVGPAPIGQREPAPTSQPLENINFERYDSETPQGRAHSLAQTWGLSDDQEAQIAAIIARAESQRAALDEEALPDEARTAALMKTQRDMRQQIRPILRQSPRLKRSLEQFMEAGKARGGTLQPPRS